MKAEPDSRDKRAKEELYVTLDVLIKYSKENKQLLPRITVTPFAFNVFKKFNKPDPFGLYRYCGVIVTDEGVTNVR